MFRSGNFPITSMMMMKTRRETINECVELETSLPKEQAKRAGQKRYLMVVGILQNEGKGGDVVEAYESIGSEATMRRSSIYF